MKPYACIFSILCLSFAVQAQDNQRQGGRNKIAGADDTRAVFLSEIPAYPGNVILARPTDHGVTATVMLAQAARIRIRYGTDGQPEQETAVVEMQPGIMQEIVLGNLPADAACHYQVVEAVNNKPMLGEAGQGTFHTCRRPGASFTFTVQADSHLDGNCLPELYKLTLANAAGCHPDFLIDLGDTFMTGKIAKREDAARQYVAQRYYFGLIGRSAPVFLTIGNHDGEEANQTGACEADGLAVWSCRQRQRYFSNPVPDAFYRGNAKAQPYAGLQQDYYAWEWGDALFVVLDPYWYSRATRGGKDPWSMTLGKAQYDWLAQTLRQSKARYKFVFIHQLVGGLDKNGRGGQEAVPLFEWGGHELNGKDTFAANRPGWENPIHQLLVETGVTAVFHGHDHFYAKQEVDGIVYQLVPQPAGHNFRNSQAAEYGYVKGEFIPSSGCLSIAVTPQTATVSYPRSALPNMERQGLKNGQPAASYTLKPRIK
jgi:hypothetical protein